MHTEYPRVLFITPCAFNGISGGGVTFSNLFRGWPRDRLATITGDCAPVSHDICQRYFFLSSRELDYVFPFNRLHPYPHPQPDAPPRQAVAAAPGLLRWIKPLAKRLLGEGGIPDTGRLSPELTDWIEAFKPDVVYTILGSPGYASLVEATLDAFRLPLVVHFMDEGATDPRRPGLFIPVIRQIYGRRLRRLLHRAQCAIGICQQMADVYADRYGRPFLQFQNTVDLDFVDACPAIRPEIPGPPVLLYAGSILPYAQRQSLLDCCRAVKNLNDAGFPLRLVILTPASDGFAPEAFVLHPLISVCDAPADDAQFFSLLRGADVLLLPVNFDAVSLHFIRLSMPTKVPAYLACGRPILAYGPEQTAQIAYARQAGWGLAVTRRDLSELALAMRRCIEDRMLRTELSRNARQAARDNHGVDVVRTRFRQTLLDAARRLDCSLPDCSMPQTSLALRTRLDFIRNTLLAVPHDTILDIGCGSGDHLTAPLARLFPASRVTGVEPDARTLEHARTAHAECPNLRFLAALPENERFDVVIASEVLEHVQEPGAFLAVLWESLHPDGVLIVTVPNGYGCSEIMSALEIVCVRVGLWPLLKRLKHALFRTTPGHAPVDTLAFSPHVNFFTEKRLLSLFEAGGFALMRRQGRMVLHNFICSNVLDASPPLAEANAWLGSRVPSWLAADWMFALRRKHCPPARENTYVRNIYERLKGRLHRWGAPPAAAG